MTLLSANESSTRSLNIRNMFSSISGSYDFLNTVLSFTRDRHWRRSTVSALDLQGHEIVLDVATGTGKLAHELAGTLKHGGRVVGVDFCQAMLVRAGERRPNIELVLATSENGPFRDNTFDSATIAFALRNVPDIAATLRETARVVKEGGKVVCLEFSRPRNRVSKLVHRFYLAFLLPIIGLVLSGNRMAYSYLGRSILEFCEPDQLKEMMETNGLTDVTYQPLTWGVVTVHVATVHKR